MKMKIALVLSAAILLSSLITTFITSSVNAQNRMEPAMITSLVQFAEDPFRQHGRQIESYFVSFPSNIYTLALTVPQGKKFIITDLNLRCGDPSTPTTLMRVYLDRSETGGDRIGIFDLSKENNYSIGMNSGIAINETESLYVYNTFPEPSYGMTFSGYYVDV